MQRLITDAAEQTPWLDEKAKGRYIHTIYGNDESVTVPTFISDFKLSAQVNTIKKAIKCRA